MLELTPTSALWQTSTTSPASTAPPTSTRSLPSPTTSGTPPRVSPSRTWTCTSRRSSASSRSTTSPPVPLAPGSAPCSTRARRRTRATRMRLSSRARRATSRPRRASRMWIGSSFRTCREIWRRACFGWTPSMASRRLRARLGLRSSLSSTPRGTGSTVKSIVSSIIVFCLGDRLLCGSFKLSDCVLLYVYPRCIYPGICSIHSLSKLSEFLSVQRSKVLKIHQSSHFKLSYTFEYPSLKSLRCPATISIEFSAMRLQASAVLFFPSCQHTLDCCTSVFTINGW